MELLHICAYYLFSHMFEHLVDSLECKGVSNDVFVPVHKNIKSAIIPKDNVVSPVCYRYYDRLWFPYKSSKVYHCLLKTLVISRYHIVHAHTVFSDGNVAYQLFKRYNIPYIVAVRMTDISTFFRYMPHLRPLGIRILQNARRIIFLSEMHKNYTIRSYMPATLHDELYQKSIVIPNGIAPVFLESAPERRQARDPFSKRIKLITVGTIDKRKNQLAIASAAQFLVKRGYDVTLLVIGSPNDKRIYRKLMKKSLVSHLPFMSQTELIGQYRAADIFVMPSLLETFGLVYAEAMSQGLPVIYTKEQGFDGQFMEGEVGFHVSANRSAEIADAILRVLADYDRISKRCIEGAKRFNWDSIAAEYIRLYEEYATKESTGNEGAQGHCDNACI